MNIYSAHAQQASGVLAELFELSTQVEREILSCKSQPVMDISIRHGSHRIMLSGIGDVAKSSNNLYILIALRHSSVSCPRPADLRLAVQRLRSAVQTFARSGFSNSDELRSMRRETRQSQSRVQDTKGSQLGAEAEIRSSGLHLPLFLWQILLEELAAAGAISHTSVALLGLAWTLAATPPGGSFWPIMAGCIARPWIERGTQAKGIDEATAKEAQQLINSLSAGCTNSRRMTVSTFIEVQLIEALSLLGSSGETFRSIRQSAMSPGFGEPSWGSFSERPHSGSLSNSANSHFPAGEGE